MAPELTLHQISSSRNGSRSFRFYIDQPSSECTNNILLVRMLAIGKLTSRPSLNCSSSSKFHHYLLVIRQRATRRPMSTNGDVHSTLPLLLLILQPFNVRSLRSCATFFEETTRIWLDIEQFQWACAMSWVCIKVTDTTICRRSKSKPEGASFGANTCLTSMCSCSFSHDLQLTLHRFTSAATGTPTLLRDSDISTEWPSDVDDENLSPSGFSPTLPGELTKISSALALFKVTRILSKTLDCLYPAKASYRLSLSKLHSISDELDQWSEELPEHLRLRFCNDKPATNLISDRSPILVCCASSPFPREY